MSNNKYFSKSRYPLDLTKKLPKDLGYEEGYQYGGNILPYNTFSEYDKLYPEGGQVKHIIADLGYPNNILDSPYGQYNDWELSNYAGESAGGAGGGIGGMTSSSKGEKDPRDQGWQQTKAAVAKSNPYAQLFYGIDEGLQGFGKMAGGTKGQRGVQFFTDPIGFMVNRGALYKEGEEKRMKEVNEFNAK